MATRAGLDEAKPTMGGDGGGGAAAETAGEPVNLALRDHQVGCEDWGYRAVAEDLHEWAQRMVMEFKLQIGAPALMVERLRGRRLGHHRRGRNGFGVLDEIALSKGLVHGGDYWLVLLVLCHELLHSWQEHWGRPASSTSFNYHNAEFRRKAASIGLAVDRYGHTYLADGDTPFRRLLERYGVQAPDLPEPPEVSPSTGSSKLRLWRCPCGVNVRVGRRDFHALCLDCRGMFERAD